MPANGVKKICNIGVDIPTSKATIDLCKRYDFMYGVIGFHPSETYEITDDELEIVMDTLEKMISENEKIVAVGEIGLDYHYPDTNSEVQKKWYKAQLNLAKKLNMPVVIHSRDAAADTMEIMKELKADEIGGVVHCYSYSAEMAVEYVNMGFYIGVGGVITFKNGRKLKETVERIPIEKVVLETDSPYLSPEPNRGKRNSSVTLTEVAKEIAKLKGLSEDEVYEITWNNAHRLYKI